jgi:hypothetical protein
MQYLWAVSYARIFPFGSHAVSASARRPGQPRQPSVSMRMTVQGRMLFRILGFVTLLIVGGVSEGFSQPTATPRITVTSETNWDLAQHTRLLHAYAATRRRTKFYTDFCSAGLSPGWQMAASFNPFLARNARGGPPFEHCCVAHDRRYHSAGWSYPTAKASVRARAQADAELRRCVIRSGIAVTQAVEAKTGVSGGATVLSYGWLAEIMQGAVSAAGGPCTGFSWRWGNGTAQCR